MPLPPDAVAVIDPLLPLLASVFVALTFTTTPLHGSAGGLSFLLQPIKKTTSIKRNRRMLLLISQCLLTSLTPAIEAGFTGQKKKKMDG